MHRYVLGRLVQSGALVLVVITLSFIFIQMAPGDPVLYLYGSQDISAEVLASIRREWGLDRPLWEQYAAYLGNLLGGNLGYSRINQQPVGALLQAVLPNTLLLAIPSLLIAAVAGVVLGTVATRRLNKWPDYAIGAFALMGYSTPPFWLGIILIVTFASSLRWLPTQGMVTLGSASDGIAFALDVVRHMILPSTVLAWWYLAAFTRVTRASMFEESRKPYLTTARMKGLSENRVFYGHALRNAAKPVSTIVALQLGQMFAGAVLTEVVFAWPGMGRMLFNAIIQHDYPIVLAVFMVVGTAVVLANLTIDLVYAVLDPRIRYV